ncbi:MAG: hypothetical protein LQ348_001730 [Seirophora lacunosa]|nr:MAG: hypothetical protein LQ348_001730 [Seirophora lacunosa]
MPFEELATGDPPADSSASPLVDIVVLHGLFESTLDTLTEASTGIVWIRDLFLPHSPQPRILTYDYDRHALLRPGTGIVDPLLSLATTFLGELVAERALAHAFNRPIVFLCHGFGGLLLKRALALSHSRLGKSTERLRSIYVSTYAILFVGTPHQGIPETALRFAHDPEYAGLSQLMISLLVGSEMLNEVADQFMPIMKQYRVFNFWEELQSEVDGTMTFLVDRDSAAPYWPDTEQCGIRATHLGMMKSRTSGYTVIGEALTRYIREAPTTIKTRWCNEKKFLDAEHRRQAEELLKPQFELGSTMNGDAEHTSEYYLVSHCSSIQFTGRKQQAQELKENFGRLVSSPNHQTWGKHKIVVVYGLGGSGKTQFCLKYAEENRANYWGVFWIDASTRENAEFGFSKLGEVAGKGSSFLAGKHWLSQCHKPWLLMIDNADDPEMEISDFFPIDGSGHILITSRNPRAKHYATAGKMHFRGMDPEEGISLLLNSAYTQNGSNHRDQQQEQLARSLGAELGYLALALSQAGATIRRNIYTLEQYLRVYLGYRDRLLPKSMSISINDTNPITTWEIPFQKIERHVSVKNKDAVDLMHLLAFLHFDGIHESIFRSSASNSGDRDITEVVYPDIILSSSKRSEVAQARLRQALGVLTDHSLIDFDPDTRSYSQHPVVHRWARDRLDQEEQVSSLNRTVGLLARSISPYPEASGRAFRRALVPHMESCLQKLENYAPSFPSTAGSANSIERFAWVYAESGLWKKAKTLQERVIKFRMKYLGRKHEDTIRATYSLGQTYWNLFDLKSTIEVQRQVIAARRWIWPSWFAYYVDPPWMPDFISYYSALSDLTLALWLAGKRDISKVIGTRACAGLLKLLGPDDPTTLNAMFNLARTLLHLREWDRAHDLLIPVLRKRKKLFGPNHPDTLMTRNELGVLYCERRQNLAIAERLVTNVLEARKVVLGEEHAYTLWSVNDLSKVLCERGKGLEAAKMLEDIIPVVTRTLGDEHVGMTMTKGNLAKAYVHAGRWIEAEQMLPQILKSTPTDHPDWVRIISGYVLVQMQLQKWHDAERNCMKVLELFRRKRVLAKENPRVIVIVEQLAHIYLATGRPNESEALRAEFSAMHTGFAAKLYRVVPEGVGK